MTKSEKSQELAQFMRSLITKPQLLLLLNLVCVRGFACDINFHCRQSIWRMNEQTRER